MNAAVVIAMIIPVGVGGGVQGKFPGIKSVFVG